MKRRKIGKRLIMAGGILALCICQSACGGETSLLSGNGINAGEGELSAGIESSMEVQEASGRIRAQDDYYGYVNQDTLRKLKIEYGDSYAGPAADIMDEVEEELETMIRQIALSEEVYETGSNEWLIRNVYRQYLACDDPAKEFIPAFQKQVSEVRSARNLGELLDFMERNVEETGHLFFWEAEVERNYYRAEENALYIGQKTSYNGIDLKSIYEGDDARRMLHTFAKETLIALGDFPEEAEEKSKALVYLILELSCGMDYGIMEAENPFITFSFRAEDEMEKLLSAIGIHRLEEICQIKENPYGGWYIQDEGQLSCLNGIFTEENLETLKTYVICELMYDYREFLTGEYEFLKFFTQDIYSDREERAVRFVIDQLPWQVGELYAKNYYTEEMDAELVRMYEDIKEGYRILIRQADWLSEKTRDGLLAKLEKMQFVKGDMVQTVEKRDRLYGDTLYETWKNLGYASYTDNLALLGTPHDRMQPMLPSQVVNAGYGTDNVFTVTTAIMHAPYFDAQADYASNLGGLGMVIAHEIGHAFDSNCIAFDADGNYRPEWIGEGDRIKLSRRAEEMVEYYAAFTVMDIYHVDGKLTCGENYADKGGMECIMTIADTGEEQRKVFENYAYIWCTLIEDRVAIEKLQADEHSPERIRVNAVLASTEEFYEVYDVKPGDGMYVEPDRRVSRWR